MEGQVKDEKALTGVHGTRNLRMEIYGDTVLGVQSKLSDAKLAVLHDTPTRSSRYADTVASMNTFFTFQLLDAVHASS
jgi:hypothetical protein